MHHLCSRNKRLQIRPPTTPPGLPYRLWLLPLHSNQSFSHFNGCSKCSTGLSNSRPDPLSRPQFVPTLRPILQLPQGISQPAPLVMESIAGSSPPGAPQFIAHLLQEIRDKRIDVDATTEALHHSKGTDIPNKTTQARAYMAPLIDLLITNLTGHAPPAFSRPQRRISAPPTLDDILQPSHPSLRDEGVVLLHHRHLDVRL